MPTCMKIPQDYWAFYPFTHSTGINLQDIHPSELAHSQTDVQSFIWASYNALFPSVLELQGYSNRERRYF